MQSVRSTRSSLRKMYLYSSRSQRLSSNVAGKDEKIVSSLDKQGRPLAFLGSTFGSSSDVSYRHATLVLEDGSRWAGISFGYEAPAEGEIVFNTGMVGYPENLTDPSYRGQFLISTYPIVGNYGVPDEAVMDSNGLPAFMESDRVQVSAFIVQDYSHHHSHWNSRKSLSQWLTEQRVPALYGVDTRALTKRIRDRGAMLAKLEFQQAFSSTDGSGLTETSANTTFGNPNVRNLVSEVSTKEVRTFGQGNPTKIVAVDMGIKYNMIRHLVDRNCEVKLVPWNHPISNEMYDGLFLSNGPGDPGKVPVIVDELAKIFDGKGANSDKPIFGICMGNQVLGTAAGATTYKMPFGNRGQNQPVLNELTGRCVITPQNHGYAIDTSTLQEGWAPLFTNKNDGSNEGIYHKEKPWFSAQFHPEARGGPTETEDFFDLFVDMASSKGKQTSVADHFKLNKLPRPDVSKVLLLGSGGLSIGQAGEFDYSGSQAIKALKEEGLETVLINPNIASVQTNLHGDNQADTVYFMPVTPAFVEEVIKKEKPDGIILSMGGQTGLNCGVELEQSGILKKYGVQVLGTSVQSIMDTEDRDRFSDKLNEINESMAPSIATETVEGALEAAKSIGYPCMIRSAYALGGLGSGICGNEEEMMDMASKALSTSPQILVEKSMLGWKELEYEVVRDRADNCITVCNMENFDPLGVHTGDSIVVAPSQTLSNDEYHMLRETAIKTVRHMGIVGECNIQYALNPFSKEYCIIEINPRLSRSSALASKATGYPLAFVAAKLALGHELPDLKNSVTQSTTACFEPALDYIVTKVPRWDLSKFDRVSRHIGSAMKSVGEVMAIGRTFEESLQKALRMVDPSVNGFESHGWKEENSTHLKDCLTQPSDTRINIIAKAFDNGMNVEEINHLTAIDPWFLYKLERIKKIDLVLRSNTLLSLTPTVMLQAKKSGFSDIQIANRLSNKPSEDDVREIRKSMNVKPFVKQIDTMAGEYPAATNYLYTTYNGDEHDVDFPNKGEGGKMVLGSGAYRIGSSVEFDWCSVAAIRTLRELGHKTVVVNYNPETVSTDYDECDRLYFEELSKERILDIYEAENVDSCIVSVGGQIPNTLALPLHEAGVNIDGTSPLMIDNAEDREKFSALCDLHGIDQPAWENLTSVEAAFDFADEVGYPVLVRPSYVLSGAAMNVAYSAGELAKHLAEAEDVSDDKPVVITKFIEGGREIDVDAVADGGKVIAHAISEHVENAGIHSGDATLMLPTQTIPLEEMNLVRETIRKIAIALEITGPFNMQLIAKDGKVQIIETNLRASRTFPFSSKTCGADFIGMATRAMVGGPQLDTGDVNVALEGADKRPVHPQGYVGVKVPMFSFKRLLGADPTLGVEMASTGEVACYGANKEEAFLKALLSTDSKFAMENKSVLVSIQDKLQGDFLPSAKKLDQELGFTLYATEKTANYLEKNGINCTRVAFPGDGIVGQEDIEQMIRDSKIDLVLMFANNFSQKVEHNYDIRRLAVDFGVPLLTNLQVAELFADAMLQSKNQANGDLLKYLQTKTLKEHYGDR